MEIIGVLYHIFCLVKSSFAVCIPSRVKMTDIRMTPDAEVAAHISKKD